MTTFDILQEEQRKLKLTIETAIGFFEEKTGLIISSLSYETSIGTDKIEKEVEVTFKMPL